MVSLSRLGASLVCRSDGACSVQCAFSLLFAYITISMIHKTFLLIQMNDSISELSSYLEKFLSTDYLPHVDFPRVNCCGSSKSLYCTECLKLLIDPSYWPESILKGELKLPFDLDIILYDNRRQCSSIHAMVLLNESLKHSSTSVHDNPIDNSSPLQTSSGSKMIHLIDIQRGDLVPSYYDNNTDDSSTCTYLLFPSSDSVPLSSVANQVRKLIVLDCKWTKCNTLPKELQNLNKVMHLISLSSSIIYTEIHWMDSSYSYAVTMLYKYLYTSFFLSSLKLKFMVNDSGTFRLYTKGIFLLEMA